MIAACPRCEARYRVDPERLGSEGVRLRCAKCEAVFRVRAPQAPAQAQPAERPAPQVDSPQAAAPPPVAGAPSAEERERLVLIADPDVEAGKATAAAVASWGLQPVLVHDGVEAILTIQRLLPRAVVMDAALPKMFGFQVCEVVKRNESLRHIHVALVASIHHQDRYRRPPSELYGADLYLEKPTLLEALAPALQRFGFQVSTAPVAAPPTGVESGPSPAPATTPSAPQVATPQPVAAALAPAPSAPGADGLAEERAKAERLARIIVSDIVLYNPEQFDEGMRSGNLLQALDSGLQEGRELFRQRIDERVRSERDYLAEELERVARSRGAQ